MAILIFSSNGELTTETTLAAALTASSTAGKRIVITTPGLSVTTALTVEGGRTLECANGGYIALSGAGSISGVNLVTPEMFGAKGDNSTDDILALEAAISVLKLSGGGELKLSKLYKISRTWYISGTIPLDPAVTHYYGYIKITGTSKSVGIVGSMVAGSVVQFGTDTVAMSFPTIMDEMQLNGGGNNVIVLNGGLSTANFSHIAEVRNILILGFAGADSVGFDEGRITDGTVLNVRILGDNVTGKGVIQRRSTVQLQNVNIFYCAHGVYVPGTAEACIQMIGGSILLCYSLITFEGTLGNHNANYLFGTFVGELEVSAGMKTITTTGTPFVPSLTFYGCLFGSREFNDVTLIDFTDFSGSVSMIGCVGWENGGSVEVLIPSTLEFNSIGNTNITIAAGSAKYMIDKPTNETKPAFSATITATQADVTGDATAYTVLFGTELFDNSAAYDPTTGIFTAQVAGKYRFNSSLYLTGLATGHTTVSISLVTPTLTYVKRHIASLAGDRSIDIDQIVDMAAGDTAKIVLTVSGGTKVVDVYGDNTANQYSLFSGEMIF